MEPRAEERAAAPRRISRRAFVIGGTGVAAVGAGGLFAATKLPLRTWWLHHTGACGPPGPIPAASAAPIEFGTFDSQVLGTGVGYALAIPPGHDFGAPLPVAIMLPGRGGTAAGNLRGTRMPDFLAQGVDGREVAPFGLASVDGGTSYWHPRTSGEDRMTMLVAEFLPMIAQRYGLGADSRKRATIGWSMGGYGAILLAERYPDVFAGVAAASPAIWQSYGEMVHAVGDAFDNAAQFEEFDVISHAGALAGRPVRIDCGYSDPFYPNIKALVAALPRPPSGGFRAGCHASDTWRWFAPGQIDFLGETLA